MAKAKKASDVKDTSCAACGAALFVWTVTTSVEGMTVCAPGTDCLGGELARIRREAEAQEPPELPESAYFDEADER